MKRFLLNNCLECPALENEHHCGLSEDPDNYIANNSKFPKWCPLEGNE